MNTTRLFIAVFIAAISADSLFAQGVSLLQHWQTVESRLADGKIQSLPINGSTPRNASPAKRIEFDENSMQFSQSQFLIVDNGNKNLPQASFSVTAWVRIDQPTRWGSIFGFQQDNGSYERGWSLGYNNDRFEFRASDGKRLINATAATPMKLGSWYLVTGVCDTRSKELRIYVNEKMVGRSPFTARGVVYPNEPDTQLVIGAYKDKDELFPMQGALREIRLYVGILPNATIKRVASQRRDVDKPIKFAVRPGVRFLTPTSAEVRWQTTVSGSCAVAFGPTRKLETVVMSDASGTDHRVKLTNLEPGKTYWYRFGLIHQSKRSFSPFYQLDGSMNYTAAELDRGQQIDAIDDLAGQLNQKGGYAVTIGDIDTEWTHAIAASTSMTVIAAVDDDDEVNRLRQRWYKQDVYGIRLSAQLTKQIPKQFANLVVAKTNRLDQALELLSPSGQLVVLGSQPDNGDFAWQKLADDVFLGEPKSRETLSQWGHQYGSTGNASFSGETLGGIDKTSDLQMKWIGRPGADFGIDRNPRMPAPLAVGGRLFHQGMNRMIALDAFNGAVLWSLEIPDLRRVNIPRDCANWCGDEKNVYAAVKDRLWVIDGNSGEMKRTLQLPNNQAGDSEWGYIAVAGELLVGTAMKTGSNYGDFWSKSSWYDDKGDQATAKVCGSAIVAFDKKYGDLKWQRPTDAVVHSTIAISGQRMYFVEVDDREVRKLTTGKLINKQIWKNASIVCLDLETGKELWKSKTPPQDHEAIISFGIADNNQYILETSGKNAFHFVSLDAKSGRQRWNRSAKWSEDHHGAHMQHAVLMNGKVFVQPHILDATTGEILKSGTLGKRRGCATPIGAGGSIVYRGGSGPLSLWSLKDESRSEFSRLRPSCWLNTIPAQGMLFSPEGGGGCSCGGWMETSIGFAPTLSGDQQ